MAMVVYIITQKEMLRANVNRLRQCMGHAMGRRCYGTEHPYVVMDRCYGPLLCTLMLLWGVLLSTPLLVARDVAMHPYVAM